MKIRPLYLMLGIITIFLLIFSPIVINSIVKSKPWFGIEAADNNDWIGFYGSYIGGLITLIALVVTIGYTTWQYKDQDRKRVQPYLTIKQLYNNIVKNETASIKEDMGLFAILSETKQSDKDIYFKELELCGEVKNIGLGTAINITFEDISFDNRKKKHVTSNHHAIAVGDRVYFRITFLGLVIEDKALNNKYREDERNGEIPEIHMNFVLKFDDMLGNTYVQEAKARVQVLESSEEGTHDPNVLFQTVTYPTLKFGKL
jgi:hypothetical protein